MKTRVIQPNEDKLATEVKYPCLLRDKESGAFVYATSATEGLVIFSPSGCGRNIFQGAVVPWAAFQCEPVRGKVVIEFDMGDGQ